MRKSRVCIERMPLTFFCAVPARKVLRGDGDYLTSSEGGGLFGAGGGRERAASAAEARQQAAAAAVAMAELTTKVEKTSQSVDSIMTALQRIQTSSEVIAASAGNDVMQADR